MQSLHALARLDNRIAETGLDLDATVREVESIAQQHKSIAVLVIQLRKEYGDTNGRRPYVCRESSNGDQVWAVCRDGAVVTWMFRRSNQPQSPAALRVERTGRVKARPKSGV